MITVIVLAWIGFLWLLVKIGIFKGWSKWMKISPVVVYLLSQVLLLIPMNLGSPAGQAIVLKHSVQIIPSVTGVVTEVPVLEGVTVDQGAELFRIDPVLYQVEVDRIGAQLTLKQQELKSRKVLAATNLVAREEVARYEAEIQKLEAELSAAKWHLEQTVVRAPARGFIINRILQPGARVTANSSAVMAFVDESIQPVAVQIAQNNLRYIKPGQKAEVIFQLYPGRVFVATVSAIHQASEDGLLKPSGSALDAYSLSADPFWVLLELDNAPQLPAGATGTAGIYTDRYNASHVFRKIVLRMQNWMNFL